MCLVLISCVLLGAVSVPKPPKVNTKKRETFLQSLSLISSPHHSCSYSRK